MSDYTIPPAFTELYAKRPQVIKPGLDRIRAALESLPCLVGRVPTVLVGGTNGKGTTSGMLWQLLRATGLRVGLFTSPHLQFFRERMVVSDQLVDDALLVDELRQLQEDLPVAVYDAMSFFEVNTLLALRVFKKLESAIDVLEVGLGGRWDATNAAEPVASVITSIGLDHAEFLGHTPAAVAYEKAGIMRPGRPVFFGGLESAAPAAVEMIESEAKQKGAILYQYGKHIECKAEHLILSLPDAPALEVLLPQFLKGKPPYLVRNFALATATCHWLVHSAGVSSSQAGSLPKIISALSEANKAQLPSLRGRFERLSLGRSGEPPRDVLLDVCHNVEGALAFVEGLRANGLISKGPLPALISILGDKDVNGILDVLRTALAPIMLFPGKNERSWSPAHLATRHADLPWSESLAAAWQWGHDQSREKAPLVICGSVALAGEVFEFFEKPS